MFKETFGNVTLETVSEAKRGLCLQASMENGERILMDICGMAIPDGTNVYFFGNKLLVVTRWADMSDAEKDRTQNGDIVLAIHPSELMQFSMKLGPHWGDVMLTLPHCYTPYNDEKAPVDQIIFVFTDKYDTDFLIARAVALPPFLQKRFQKALATSHEMIDLDEAMPTLLANSRTNETKDVWDLVYDVCWRVIAPYDREARSKNFEVEDGLYVEINGDNEIVNVEQHEVKAEPEMSDEVKLYLQLAQTATPRALTTWAFATSRATAWSRILKRRCTGTPRQPKRATTRHSIISAFATPTATVSSRTTRRPFAFTSLPLSRAICTRALTWLFAICRALALSLTFLWRWNICSRPPSRVTPRQENFWEWTNGAAR